LADDPEAGADTPRSIIEHLEEMRRRIIFSLAMLAVCTALVYAHVPAVLNHIVRPAQKLYFMAPAEAFWVQVKLALMIGAYCALPLIFYQAWRFVEIGLRRGEKQFLLPLAAGSFLLFTAGGGFCYYFVVPVAVRFLLSYGSDVLVPLLSVSRYVSFLGTLVFAFGITFQLPLVLLFLARLGMVQSARLRVFRRYAVLLSFIIGAALTPTPDMVNQALLAVPLIILYEISIWLVKLFEVKNKSLNPKS